MVWLPTAGIITSYIGFRSRMPASLISQQNMDILILEDRVLKGFGQVGCQAVRAAEEHWQQALDAALPASPPLIRGSSSSPTDRG
ncbi:uncharacterized protein [Triticum aestivum]|uniref:uncharacterized protein isoform X2 n=1 Tax=Triticum aestivum TaxID=4565 RepID=UPI001D016996|nr:uncharacterized protein LOC123114129 isoform X2 [Triticum aestivum]